MMPIRTVKQHSDRGNIKNLASSDKGSDMFLPSPYELRLKKLYEFAQVSKDKNLQSALGFITTDYISDKNALPLSVYRIRQIVSDIKAVSGFKIDNLAIQFEGLIKNEIGTEAIEYITRKRIKTASIQKFPFWRARK